MRQRTSPAPGMGQGPDDDIRNSDSSKLQAKVKSLRPLIAHIHAGAIIDDDLPLVPPGEYVFRFVRHSTWLMFGRSPKLILDFSIADHEMYTGVILKKYYNVKKLRGKHGRNGNFTVGRKSNFLRDFFRVCPAYPPKRLDRIPMSRLDGIDVHGKVKTVTKGHDQKEIPEPLQYSVITELLPQ